MTKAFKFVRLWLACCVWIVLLAFLGFGLAYLIGLLFDLVVEPGPARALFVVAALGLGGALVFWREVDSHD